MPRVCAFLILAMMVGMAYSAEVTLPSSTDVVVDQAGVIDAQTRSRIVTLFVRLRELTTAEVKVLTVTSTGGEDIVAFAQRHYDLWHLGQLKKDNGALIVLATADHHVRIHTGYGLEPILPDSWCGSLSRSVANSHFKVGQFAVGLEQISRAVAGEVAAAAHVDLKLDTGSRFTANRPEPAGWHLGGVLFFIFSAFVIFKMLAGQNRPGSRSWGSSYGGFGGFGGGGTSGNSFGGGFSGGGGRSGGGGGGASW